jgi:hypothetical protein
MDSTTKERSTPRSTASKRKLAGISRWLHIYLSMVSFAIVLFFSVTGITLNHADTMQGETKTSQVKGKLNAAWVQSPDTNKVEKLLIAEYFRNQHAVKGAVNDLRIEEDQVSIAYKGPGYEAMAFINRASGEYELTVAQTGLVGFLNDLHKGRDTGKTWASVIDIAAGLMVLISLTGLILLLFIKRKRVNGLVLLAAGTIIVYLLYRIWGQ